MLQLRYRLQQAQAALKEKQLMAGELRFQVQDYTGEKAAHAVDIPDITAANFAAIMDPGGLVADYYDNLNAICIGNITKEVISARNITISSGNAGSAYAQVELRWYVPYTDNVTGKLYGRTIPCPDLTLLTPGSDNMNMLSVTASDFKAAFEALVVSPDGNPVTMGVPYVVGRNS